MTDLAAPTPATGKGIAVLAALFTVSIWANFLISTGAVVQSGLGIVEVGLLRSVACSLALLPVLWRMGVYPKGLAFWRFLVMTIGAGIGFMALMPLGFQFAPAGSSGVFAPGLLPLWVAGLSAAFLGEKIGALRVFGFALIAVGVLAVGGLDALKAGADGAWKGYLLFASASFGFACYAVAQRGSGLTALEATALISVWTLPAACIAALVFGADFSGVPVELLAWTAFAQVASGVVSILAYTFAIIRLGPSRASAFMALTPAVVALAAVLVLGEAANPFVWIGVAVVSAGVLVASGILERRGGA